MAVVEARHAASDHRVSSDGLVSDQARVRVDGKFFIRGGRRFRVHGVTYGPFAPNAGGEPYPTPGRVRHDFRQMRSAGVNAIRTYHLPPQWFLYQADEQGVAVLLDMPWRKHLCFLDSGEAQREARQLVRRAVQQAGSHPCLLAYSLGNEIPPSVVRWHGARPV